MSSPKTASATQAKKPTNSPKPAATSASSTPPVSTTASAPAPQASVVTSVDPNVVTQCISLLAQVDGLLGPVTPLSASQARRMLKLRKGGAQVIPDSQNLCGLHGVTSVGPITVAAMSASMAQATLLNQIGVQLETLRKHLNDATFAAESQAWQNATALYTVLQRVSVVDPTLANGLKPIQAFFRTKRTKGTSGRAPTLGSSRRRRSSSPRTPPRIRNRRRSPRHLRPPATVRAPRSERRSLRLSPRPPPREWRSALVSASRRRRLRGSALGSSALKLLKPRLSIP